MVAGGVNKFSSQSCCSVLRFLTKLYSSQFQKVTIVEAVICIDYYAASAIVIPVVFCDQDENIGACCLHDDALTGGEYIFFVIYLESKRIGKKPYLAVYIFGKYGYVFYFHNKFTVIVGYWYRKTRYQRHVKC